MLKLRTRLTSEQWVNLHPYTFNLVSLLATAKHRDPQHRDARRMSIGFTDRGSAVMTRKIAFNKLCKRYDTSLASPHMATTMQVLLIAQFWLNRPYKPNTHQITQTIFTRGQTHSYSHGKNKSTPSFNLCFYFLRLKYMN